MPNKKTSNNNYGASEPVSAIAGLLAGAKAIGAKVAAKIGAKVAAKAAAKKAGKAGAKALAKGSTKFIDKAAKTAAKSKNLALKADKASKVKEATKKGREATNKIAKESRKSGVENLKMKAQNVAQKGNDKLANLTGNSPDEMTDILKQKAAQGTISAGGKIAAKAQESNQDSSSYVNTDNTATNNEDPAMSSYSNPTGPSAYFNPKVGPSMRKGLKYDNCGASLPVKGVSKTTSGKLKSNQPIFSSLNSKNIIKDGASLSTNNIKTPAKKTAGQKGMDFLKGFNANVNIGGFNLNVGKVATVASNLGKSASNKIKVKKLNKIQANYNMKMQDKKEAANNKIMQNLVNTNIQKPKSGPLEMDSQFGKNIKEMSGKSFMSGGIKPSYKK